MDFEQLRGATDRRLEESKMDIERFVQDVERQLDKLYEHLDVLRKSYEHDCEHDDHREYEMDAHRRVRHVHQPDDQEVHGVVPSDHRGPVHGPARQPGSEGRFLGKYLCGGPLRYEPSDKFSDEGGTHSDESRLQREEGGFCECGVCKEDRELEFWSNEGRQWPFLTVLDILRYECCSKNARELIGRR